MSKHSYGTPSNAGGYGGGKKGGKDRGTGFSGESSHGRKTIGSNSYKSGLTPVASTGSKTLTNGERKPVSTSGGGVGIPRG